MPRYAPALALLSACLVLPGCIFGGGEKWPSLAIEVEQGEADSVDDAVEAQPEDGSQAEDIDAALAQAEAGVVAIEARLPRHRQDADWVRQSVADQRTRFENAAMSLPASGLDSERARNTWNAAQIELTRLASAIADISQTEARLAEDAGRLARLVSILRRALLRAEDPAASPAASLLRRSEAALAAIGEVLDGVETARAEGEAFAAEQQMRLIAYREGPDYENSDGLPKDRVAYLVTPAPARPDAPLSPEYKERFKEAARKALQRYADVRFDIFAIPPKGASAGAVEGLAWDMRRILRELGVADDRVTVSHAPARGESGEVRVYLR